MRILITLFLLTSTSLFAAKVNFSDAPNAAKADTLVVFGTEDTDLSNKFAAASAQIERASEAADFSFEKGSTLELLAADGIEHSRLVLVGLGSAETIEQEVATKMAGNLVGKLAKTKAKIIDLDVRGLFGSDNAQFSAWLAHGINLRQYSFDKYKKEKDTPLVINLVSNNTQTTKQAFAPFDAIEQGVFLARNLISETSTYMTPIEYVEIAEELEDLDNVSVKVLEPREIKKLGMGALEAVGRGSKMGSRLIVVHYEGDEDATPIALAGKGITFDSGGYNIKTGSSINRMKSDMAGAAAVMGTVKALALQKAKVNVVAVMGMAANMVSENSVTPGDVIRTAEGLSVEILNTDAEGRLVLSDAMWYARTYYKPEILIDVATLTGSKIRAVGNDYAAIFSDDDDLIAELTAAGETVNENLWRLPLDYKEMLKSSIADIANIGSGGPGASTAASFLQHFAGDVRWAHLDIAGNALASSAKGEVAVGGTGFGVRLLTQWINDISKEQ